MCVMQHDVTPHITSHHAADLLGIKPREVLALIDSGTLDSFMQDGRLRVSFPSVVHLAAQQHRDELRRMGVR